MAKEYYEKLTHLIEQIDLQKGVATPLEVKHFFSGAALYINQVICASWSPVGLAFKLPEKEVDRLISNGKAVALRYFPNGHIKKGYALFVAPEDESPDRWKKYFLLAIKQL